MDDDLCVGQREVRARGREGRRGPGAGGLCKAWSSLACLRWWWRSSLPGESRLGSGSTARDLPLLQEVAEFY